MNPADFKLLIIDDSQFDRSLVAGFLDKKGFKTFQAESAAQGLEMIESVQPDLVLMDFVMPVMSGPEALQKIRSHYNSVELPVIMSTSKNESSDIVQALGLGANDYITKPIDFDVAEMRILTHLKITDLNREMNRLKQVEAIGAMITTYNHEINNPLSVALGNLKIFMDKKETDALIKVDAALWKIADIVKKIEEASHKESVQYEDYSVESKMIKLK